MLKSIEEKLDLSLGVETPTFFNPDEEMINWIGEYANNRLIVDIGAGNFEVLKKLKRAGYHKSMGLEPYVNYTKVHREFIEEFSSVCHIIPHGIHEEQGQHLLSQLPSETVLFIMCRPCHHPYLIDAAFDFAKKIGVEILYIGIEKNFEMDLYQREHEILEHKGTSEANEKVIKMK